VMTGNSRPIADGDNCIKMLSSFRVAYKFLA
jgi:hypothetical protein